MGPTALAWPSFDVVERTIAWLHGFCRRRIRWERCDGIHEAFLGLAVPAGLRACPALATALASLPIPDRLATAANSIVRTGAVDDAARERKGLPQDVFGLRAKSRTAPLIGLAQGI